MSQKSGRRVIGRTETFFLHKSSHRDPGIWRGQGAGSREYNIGSVTVCPVLLWQQMGGAADDHLHDIQWLQGFCVPVLLTVLVLTAHGHRRLSVCL